MNSQALYNVIFIPQALSYHGWKLNVPVTVVMPKAAPIMKIQKCRNYKANVIVEGRDMAEAKALAMKMSEEKQLLYINGYDHPHIMAGQGTIGLEILEQVPNPDAVIIPVGGGGLIAGIATAIKALSPKTKIIVSLKTGRYLDLTLTYGFRFRAWNQPSARVFPMLWRIMVPFTHLSRIPWPTVWQFQK